LEFILEILKDEKAKADKNEVESEVIKRARDAVPYRYSYTIILD